MARPKGSANLSASLEVLAGAPLDARTVVNDLTELVTASTFPYYYVGMPVAVKSEEAVYLLIGTPTTDIANWKEIGATGKPEIEWGYLYNNKMYKESTHVTEITAETDMLYITKDTDKFYKFDGTDYVQIGGGVDAVVYQPGGSYLFENIPALSSATLGFVYDVSNAFTTTSDFLEGAGIDYPAGTNIVVVNVGTKASPVYKYDVLIGELSGYQKKIQYTALPTASADYEGQIYQYMGATTVYHTNGYFYKCVSDGETPATYSWVEWNVQSGGGSSGHTIKDNGVAMESRSSLNLIGFDVTDNDGDDETDVEAHRLTSEEMGEILETLPGAPTDLPRYSTNEQVVGYWIDGKPLYQRTLAISNVSIASSMTSGSAYSVIDTTFINSISNLEEIKSVEFVCNVIGTGASAGKYGVDGKAWMEIQFNGDIWAGQSWSNTAMNCNVYLTVQYTKTTDVAP